MATPSFSIFNSEHAGNGNWRAFVKLCVWTLVLLAVLSFTALVLIDPYDSVSFSPDIKRVQVDKKQRFFYPALARRPQFDSALIGNSNIRLLRPARFNQLLGGNWANLAMNAASSWEQEKIFDVFLAERARVENVLVGIDYLWCYDRYADERFVGNNTEADFPAWLYDEDPSNNIPPLNLMTLEHAGLLALTNLGIRDNRFGEDGYTVFTNPMSDYNLEKARTKIYGSVTPKKILPVVPPFSMSTERREALPISALTRLDDMLGRLPGSARKILFFVPYHSYYQARPYSKQMVVWNECKRRAAHIASAYDNAFVLDFMIRSDITEQDSNYWDYKHYTVDVAEQLADLIGSAVNEGAENNNYLILHAPQ